MVAEIGEAGPGLMLILSGEVEVTQRDGAGCESHIVTHERGNFMGELAQLSGRPVAGRREGADRRRGIAIAPDRLRALLIAEAELGERIMRALILRRMGLIEAGAGPGHHRRRGRCATCCGSSISCAATAIPTCGSIPTGDNCAQTLVDRFEVDDEELPIVLCPSGKLLRNPTEQQLARCVGLVGPIDTDKLYDVVIIGAGPSGLGDLGLCRLGGPVGPDDRLPLVRRSGGRIGADRKLSRLPDRHFRHGADGPGLQPGAEVRCRNRDPGRSREARVRQRSLPHAARHRRTRPGAVGRARNRRPLPEARGRPAGRVRRIVRPLLGIAARGRSLRRAWTSRWSAAAIAPGRRPSSSPAGRAT